jgi:uncharacterized protein YicC (UPF0701 family)
MPHRPATRVALLAAALIAGKVDAVAPSVDGLLAIKGVVEVAEPEGDEEEDKAARGAAAEAFDRALTDLVEMRKREGISLGQILTQRVDEIEQLAKKAEAAPGAMEKKVVYKCEHCNQTADKPGKCPMCGMDMKKS